MPPPTAIVLNFPSNPTGHVVVDFYQEVELRPAPRQCSCPIRLCRDLLRSAAALDPAGAGAKDVAVEFTRSARPTPCPAGASALPPATRSRSRRSPGSSRTWTTARHADPGGGDRRAQSCDDSSPRTAPGIASVATSWSRDWARSAGLPAPPATMFVWAPIPAPYRELGSLEFSKLLLREAKVAVSPGLGFGEYGEGFVRFALVENRQRIRQAVRNIRRSSAGSAPDRGAGGGLKPCASCAWASPASARWGARCCGCWRKTAGCSPSAPAASSGHRGLRRAIARATAASILPWPRWYDDPLALAADPRSIVVVELIGGADGPALALCRPARSGQAGGDREQGLLAHHGAELARWPRRTASPSASRRRSPAAFRSSRPCARRWPATGSAASTAS